MSADEAVTAAAEALRAHRAVTCGHPGGYECKACGWHDGAMQWERHQNEVMVAAARPIIEREVRAKVAAEIQVEASRSSYRDQPEVTEAYLDAARIAEGTP